MILEARSAGCFSWTYVLKLDERAIGKFEGQWFSENLTVDLTERRHMEFRKMSWLGSQFDLVDLNDEEVIVWCDREGMFSSTWDLNLSTGPGKLVHGGFFQTYYEFYQDGDSLARVDRLGVCERGFIVDGAGVLETEDLLLIGLVYHTIMNRRQSQQNAGGAAAGS